MLHRIREMRLVVPVMMIMSLCMSTAASANRQDGRFVGNVRLDGAPGLNAEELRNSDPHQWRWLSLPMSRLVINPASSDQFAPLPMRPDLPLHLGYYVGKHPHRLLDVLTVGLRPQDDSRRQSRSWHWQSRPAEDFARYNSPWHADGVSLAADGMGGRITVQNKVNPWGAASIHLDSPFTPRSGMIRIEVPEADGHWALKLSQTEGADLVIQGDTRQTGTFVYRLEEAQLDRLGTAFALKIFANGSDESVIVDSIELTLSDEKGPEAADQFATAWYPHKLTFEADFARQGMTLTGFDYFHDENTIVRAVKVKGDLARESADTELMLSGALPGDLKPVRSDDGMLCLSGSEYHAVIRFFSSKSHSARIEPHNCQPRIDDWGWHLAVPVESLRDDAVYAVVALATRAEGLDTAVARAADLLKNAPGERLKQRRRQWEGWLKQVPTPTRFGTTGAAGEKLAPDVHRLHYYGAWAFILSNVLPPMAENDYPFPQTPCGKPSLWAYGASKATASAAWESFFSQQLLAHVMPETAWSAFEGIMAQVDDTGWLDGECLPSRKAQTAWILYRLTNDRERLARVYPAIRRYLLWREQQPRWIYLTHDIPDEKDASFVDHLLVDMDYAVRIARVLGHDIDVAMWQARHVAVIESYREWFFPGDQTPVEFYYTGSGERKSGNLNWVVTGLHIPGLPDDLAGRLNALFDELHDPAEPLAGRRWVKYGTMSFTVYGLIEHGRFREARELMEAVLRDQIRAGEFSENYGVDREGNLHAWGVKPAVFGAAQMIDFTCLLNGARLDQGEPVEVHWP